MILLLNKSLNENYTIERIYHTVTEAMNDIGRQRMKFPWAIIVRSEKPCRKGDFIHSFEFTRI